MTSKELVTELWVVLDPSDNDSVYSAPYEEACHEHINEAIGEDIDGAGSWIVRRFVLAHEPGAISQEEARKLLIEYSSARSRATHAPMCNRSDLRAKEFELRDACIAAMTRAAPPPPECAGCEEFVRMQHELASLLGVDADTDSIDLHGRIYGALSTRAQPTAEQPSNQPCVHPWCWIVFSEDGNPACTACNTNLLGPSLPTAGHKHGCAVSSYLRGVERVTCDCGGASEPPSALLGRISILNRCIDNIRELCEDNRANVPFLGVVLDEIALVGPMYERISETKSETFNHPFGSHPHRDCSCGAKIPTDTYVLHTCGDRLTPKRAATETSGVQS